MTDAQQPAAVPAMPTDSLNSEFVAVCRDIGYEVGLSLKPERKAQLFTALADLNELALELRSSTDNPSLNGFLDGVITALEQ